MEEAMPHLLGSELYVPGDASAKELVIKTTGGTMGRPRLFIARMTKEVEERGALEAFLRITARNYLRHVAAHRALFFSDAEVKRVWTAGQEDLRHSAFGKLFAEFNPTVVQTTPALLSLAADRLRVLSAVPARVMLGGELLSRRIVGLARELFPQSEILFSYNSSETGPVGTSCPVLEDALLSDALMSPVHPHAGCHVAIREPDADGLGEIVVSTYERQDHATGDRGKLVRELCVCGAEETLFVYGRFNHDVINTAGATILSAEIERVLGPFLGLTDYLVEVEERDVAGRMLPRLHCSIVAAENAAPDLVSHVADALAGMFVTKTRTLGRLVEEGIFLESVVALVPELPQREKKIRLRRMQAGSR